VSSLYQTSFRSDGGRGRGRWSSSRNGRGLAAGRWKRSARAAAWRAAEPNRETGCGRTAGCSSACARGAR